MSVRVRFAPSPTGFVHIGSLRTALYNYLYAAKMGGEYILRIEDTDRTRYVEGAIEGMLGSMEWAGVMHSEGPFLDSEGNVVQRGEKGPYIQSERLELYKKYAEQLIDQGHAYYCFCSKERLEQLRAENSDGYGGAKYDGHCRACSLEDAKARVLAGEPHVVRLKLPENTDISFSDLVRGNVTVNTDDMDDQVLMKNDGFPTYHMAVIVDDHLMGITHVIRGEEWLPSTPKHVYLYQAFGWEAPKYVHLPNILNTEKKKLSKRQGDVSVQDFMDRGYLPEALVNYIALVGWSPEDNREKMTMDEMKELFSFDRVSKAGGVFDVAKLKWMNNLYIKEMDTKELTKALAPFMEKDGLIDNATREAIALDNFESEKANWAVMVAELSVDYIDVLSEISEFAAGFSKDELPLWGEEEANIMSAPHVPELLKLMKSKIQLISELSEENVKPVMKELQKELGVKGKDLFMPVRVGVSGEVHGPDLIKSIMLLGKDRVINRLEQAVSRL